MQPRWHNDVKLLWTATTKTTESKMASGSTVEDELVLKSRATSIVWKWFGYKILDVQQTMVICK